jgi:hypothetical protein
MTRAEVDSLDKASLADLLLRQAEQIAELEARLVGMERRFAEVERHGLRAAGPSTRTEINRFALALTSSRRT